MIYFRQIFEKRFRLFVFGGSAFVLAGVYFSLTLTQSENSAALKTGFFTHRNFLLGIVFFIAGCYVFLRILRQLFSRRGRRIFLGKIKRPFIREFWPRRFFYLPVIAYVGLLALKHRSLTIFTCANPAIRAGGFVGDSKEKILRGLYNSPDSRPFILKHLFLAKSFSAAEKLRLATDFMTEQALTFPIVVKPDVGERGAGVFIVRQREDLAEKLAAERDLILQEFAAGEELSVFYYRHPASESGRILAITEKRFPKVTGDGTSTLEELILRDDRAVCLAEKYLEQNAERLETIPEPGVAVPLTDFGTHSRGAIYLDGGWLKTAALEQKIDRICRGFEGFYYGKFDIRVKSFDDVGRAQNFKIVELNGVKSDATTIFDPKNALFDAYRTLFRQWRIAFEIGAENRRRGAEPTKLADLIKLIFSKPIRKSESEIQDPQCV